MFSKTPCIRQCRNIYMYTQEFSRLLFFYWMPLPGSNRFDSFINIIIPNIIQYINNLKIILNNLYYFIIMYVRIIISSSFYVLLFRYCFRCYLRIWWTKSILMQQSRAEEFQVKLVQFVLVFLGVCVLLWTQKQQNVCESVNIFYCCSKRLFMITFSICF